MPQEYTVKVHFIDGTERVVPAKDIQYVGGEGARRGTALVDGREVPIYKRSEPEWGPLWYEQAQRVEEEEPLDLVAEQMHRIESPDYNELGEDEPLYHFPDEEEDDEYTEDDGSGLHQCPYCYNLVNEEHEEFCQLNPNRNENF